MQTRAIDGRGFADSLLHRLAIEVAAAPVRPGLAVVLVGEDAASAVYVRNKARQTVAVGMHSVVHRLDAGVTKATLLDLMAALNRDVSIHGILVQLPLPGHIDGDAVLAAIDPAKDVDGFHVVNAGRLALGLPGLAPCTPVGCCMLLTHTLGTLAGLRAVVVGRSNIVGKPMAQLLLREDCTVTVAHSRTRDLPGLCREADVLVAAVGRAEMVRGDWIKPGATVIDVGINRVADADGGTRLVGDVCWAEAQGVAGHITPVPGGVGPMTIAVLLRNTLAASRASTAV